jgi:sortase A
LVTTASPRSRRRSRLTAAAFVLALAGVALIAYPFATNLWAAHLQGNLSRELTASASDYRSGRIGEGHALTRLQIPSLDVDVIVVEGTSPAALRAGAGHYPKTPLPGEAGNVAIAGHRTTYGRPFNRIGELKAGDRIVLTTPVGRDVYEVSRDPWVVEAHDWTPIRHYPAAGSWLTLTTCHPEGSADYRIAVRAQLASAEAVQ